MFMVGITKNLESVLRKTLFGVLEKNLMTMHEQLVKFQFVEQIGKALSGIDPGEGFSFCIGPVWDVFLLYITKHPFFKVKNVPKKQVERRKCCT